MLLPKWTELVWQFITRRRPFSRRFSLQKARHSRYRDRNSSVVKYAEVLEARTLLSAMASNVFAEHTGAVTSGSGTDSWQINMRSQDWTGGQTPLVGFHVMAAGGSTFNPAAVTIVDSTTHVSVSPTYSARDTRAGVYDSVVLAPLSLSHQYTIKVSGETNTTGAYVLDLFLPGDANGDHKVTAADGTLISGKIGALVGSANYTVEADANLDGVISASDLATSTVNVGVSTSIAALSLSSQFVGAMVQLADGTSATNIPVRYLSGKAEPGAVISLETGSDGNFDEGTTTANSAGNYSLAVTLTAGNSVIQLRATDPFGQQGATSLTTFLDTHAPITVIQNPASGVITNKNISISGVVTDDHSAVASLQVALDSAAYSTITVGTLGNFSYTTAFVLDGTKDGSHTLHFRATDKVGNVSSPVDEVLILDTFAPTVTLTAPLSGMQTNQNITITGSTADTGTGVSMLQASVDGGAYAALNLDAQGHFSDTTAFGLDGTQDGSHTVSFRATDKAGNVSAVKAVPLILDTRPPVITVDSPASGVTTATNLTLSGQITDAVSGVGSLSAQIDSGPIAPIVIDSTGHFSFATTLPLGGTADGAHVAHLVAVDKVGNPSAPTNLAFTLDSQPPKVVFDDPTSGTTVISNLTLFGHVTDNNSGVASVQAQMDSGAPFGVSLDAFGNFNFTTDLALDGSNDGERIIHVRATDHAGNVTTQDFSFFLDTQPPTIEFDGPTSGTVTGTQFTITGRVTDAVAGVNFLVATTDPGTNNQTEDFPNLDQPGELSSTFTFTTSLPLDGSADGLHTITLQASDNASHISEPYTVTFTLRTSVLAAPVFDLSSTSNVVGPQQTTASRVTLVGQTAPNVTVTLLETGAKAVASNTGAFQFPNVLLSPGDNLLTAHAEDTHGNSRDFSRTIQRQDAAVSTDVVLEWNRILLDAIRLDDSPPPIASRNMAIVQGAVYDAVSAIQGTPGYFLHFSAPSWASPIAAVASAADRALDYLYPSQAATFDAALASRLAQIPDGQQKTEGVNLGQSVANAILALRANDGYQTFVDYVPDSAPGKWQPTAPMYAQALLPQWAALQPFAMTSDQQFRPSGPPALSSQAWADAYNEVKTLGSANSTVRTADQTQIARFWADGGGSYTPLV